MNPEPLKKILADISKVKIAVIGDFCLDAYWFVDLVIPDFSRMGELLELLGIH